MRRPVGDKRSVDEVIEQAGALCLRTTSDGTRQVLLVGSRRNGRWGLPKGHIDAGESSHAAAAREAFEEAGVRGSVSDAIHGSFLYSKDGSPHRYRVIVRALNISDLLRVYPERDLRKRQWFAISEAASAAGHPGLRELLITLIPGRPVRETVRQDRGQWPEYREAVVVMDGYHAPALQSKKRTQQFSP